MSKKKAIIIGAGPAGITAAIEFLKQTDIKPIIFEETDEIGGISRTVKHNGNRMDIGGHRFFSKDDRVMNWWLDLMPLQSKPAKDDIILKKDKPLAENGADPEKEDEVLLIRERVSRILFLRKFFDYPISMSARTFMNMGLSRTMKAGFSYIGSKAVKREEVSLEDFMINRFGKVLYSMFFEKYTEKLWGVHPSKISADWGAQRIKGLSLTKALIAAIKKPFTAKSKDIAQKDQETSLIEQFIYPKFGPGQLWEIAAKKVTEMGGEIVMGARTVGVNVKDNMVVSITVEKDGVTEEVTGDYFISSMPIKDLIPAFNGVDVPEKVSHTAVNLPYRDFITVGLLVNKLNLKNTTKIKTVSNIIPDTWIYIQEADVKIGRLQVFNNWSPYLVKDLENKVWIGLEYFCDEGDKYWDMSDDDFIKFAISELVEIDVIDKEDVIDSTRVRVKKAYPAYFGTYAQFNLVKQFLDGYNNLFCVGRNGQHRYNNMDHSMLTAMESVAAIKSGSTSKKDIWSVNSEEEYHETKGN